MSLLHRVKQTLNYGFWSFAVLILILYTALFVSVFPPFALLAIIPILVFAFVLIEPFEEYPHKFLTFLALSWLFLSVVWPYFVVYHIPGLFDLRPTRLFLTLLLIVWIYYFFKSNRLRTQLSSYREINPLFFWMFWFFVLTKIWGILFSAVPGETLSLFIKELVEIMLPALVILSLIRHRQDVENILNIMIWMAIIVVAVGLFEYRIQANVLATYLPASLLSAQDYVATALSDKIRGDYRLQSLFGHPLVYAQFVIVALPFVVYRLIYSRKKIVKVAMLFLILTSLIVLWGTGSRAIFPAIATELIVLLLVIFYKTLVTNRSSFIGWLYVTLLPLFTVALLVVITKAKRFIMGQSNSEYLSTQARLEMWSRGFGVIESDPIGALFGFGLYRAAMEIDWKVNGEYTIDSYFLNILLDTGVIGFALFIFLFGYVLYRSVRLWKESNFTDALPIVLITSLSGFLMVALILSLTHILHVYYVLFMAVFALVLLGKHEGSRVR